jgi:AraC-like DNA-binding protein
MVRNGHTPGPSPAADVPIPRFGFQGPAGSEIGFEALEVDEIRRRIPAATLQRVHRLEFHTLTLVTAGTGRRTVDFVDHECRPGTVLWVRPGQVQRHDPGGRLQGLLLMFAAEFPPAFSGSGRLLPGWYGRTIWQLDGTGLDSVAPLFAQLRTEFDQPGASAEILQLLLAALLLTLDRLPDPGRRPDLSPYREIFLRFRHELENSYSVTRRAEDYADRLGYSVKTLSRAVHDSTGHPVKHAIDDRVALEAKRLLAHTDEAAATIGRRLGFDEPTNFGKFFRRWSGTTPANYRRQQRDTPPSATPSA